MFAGRYSYLLFVRFKKPISIPAIQICNILNKITVPTRPRPAAELYKFAALNRTRPVATTLTQGGSASYDQMLDISILRLEKTAHKWRYVLGCWRAVDVAINFKAAVFLSSVWVF